MTPGQLKHYGSLLFGRDWQLGISLIKDVHRRTVRGWFEGRSPIPQDIDLVLLKEFKIQNNMREAAMRSLKKKISKK